ncbi:MAG: hypothetical protein AAGB51_05640 [Planctomycetota bacterium]
MTTTRTGTKKTSSRSPTLARLSARSLAGPIGVSLTVHAAALAALLGVTLSVQTSSHSPPTAPTSAVLLPSFTDPSFEDESVAPPPLAPPEAPPPRPPDAGELERLDLLDESPGVATTIDDTRTSDLLQRLESVDAAARSAARANSGGGFSSARASRGRRVVYAVDGSGAMVSCLGFVLDELVRSVSKLSEGQEVAVVLFRRPPGESDAQFEWPLGEQPIAVRPDIAKRLASWAEGVTARGRSAPIEGLQRAMALEPDVVFFLTRGVERTAGQPWAGGPRAALDALDALDDVAVDGRPPAIKPVQFIDPDPTGVMAAIARTHDPDAEPESPRPYLLLELDELRAPASTPGAPDVEQDSTPPGVLTAARELSTLTAAGTDTRLLFGLQPERHRATVQRAVSRARVALRGLTSDDDPRVPLLLARCDILGRRAGLESDLEPTVAVLASHEPDRRDPSWHVFEFARRALLAQAYALLDDWSLASDWRQMARSLLETHGDDPLLDPALGVELSFLSYWMTTPNSHAERMGGLATDGAPFVIQGRHDPVAFRLAFEASAAWHLRQGRPEHAIRTLSEAADDERCCPFADRRALIDPFLAMLINGEIERGTLVEPALLAEATEAERDASRTSDAIELFDLAAGLDGPRRNEAERRAALLAARRAESEPAMRPDAGRRLLGVWTQEQGTDRGAALAAAALGFLRESPAYTSALRRVVTSEPMLTNPDGWRLELARAEFEASNVPAGFDAIDGIGTDSDRAGEAAALAAWAAARSLADSSDPDLAARALETQRRLGGSHAPIFRLALARHAERNDPHAAAEAYEELLTLASPPAPTRTLRLGLARARTAMSKPDAAIDALHPLLSLRAPPPSDPDAFWEAWAIALELMRAEGADTSAHLLRLRSIDAALGGTRWSARLEGVELDSTE